MEVKDVLDGIIEKEADDGILITDPGDYIGEDGLLYCGNCHTRKQRSIFWPLSGKEMIVSVLCKCGEERREKEEAEIRRKEEMDRIKRAKAPASMTGHFLSAPLKRMTVCCHS